jgi:hypothetical protein
MNKYIKILFVGFFLIMSSCDDNFAEINTDPNRAGQDVFNPNLILPNTIHAYANATNGYSGALLFQAMWVQLMASTTTGGANYYSNGDKYVESGSLNSYIQNVWNTDWPGASRARQMSKLATGAELGNLAAIGKMVEILHISFISDIYGSVPYSEALMADEGVTFPIYDRQEDMYPQMLQDLEAAILALNASGDIPTNDTLYGGDISKWRKFGYSLMLKLAMRLVNADATTAQTYVSKAAAGGVFASADDEAIAPSDDSNGFSNTNAGSLNVVDDLYEVRWGKVLMDYLISTNDPRIPVIAEIPPAGLAGNFSYDAGDNDPAIQVGMPNGWDLRGGASDISNEPNYPGPTGSGADESPIGNYSRPTAIYRDFNAGVFILTYAEVQLLLAEAAVRGYSVPGTAADYYSNGVIGAMASLNKYGGGQISASDAAAYAAANPLDESSTAASLSMINWQIWATTGTTGNFVEAWNNWKRSDIPVLTPVNYAGNFTGGEIPVRQLYPAGEQNVNPEGYAQGVSNNGGDTWTTNVWWDQ